MPAAFAWLPVECVMVAVRFLLFSGVLTGMALATLVAGLL
jgi:hypothetical protein